MARSIWKGTLGFGLVNIGIELLTAESPNDLDLDMLDRRDSARIGYQKINKTTGEVVPQSEIVKGLAVSEDKYVILTDADLKAANPKATQSIDIVGFVPNDAIPIIYYAKPYYVSPLKGSERAYALLRDALERTERIGVAQVVIHTRQYVAAVYPYQEAIVAQLLRYEAELKTPATAGVRDVRAPAKAGKNPEAAMADQLIGGMTTDWKPSEFEDTYRNDIKRLVKERAKKGGGKKSPPIVAAADEPRVLDLMAALKKSLSDSKGSRKASRATSASKAAKTRRGRVA